ncbi:MAG: aldose 1-epimerase family protein [Mariniblastus sp.]|nr:aldose 1-epimerase family protein [Mariniblastus sp.]
MIKVLSARDNVCAEDGVLAGGIDWSVTKKTLVGGRQQGVEVLQVDNGKLQFDVILTRGMSVGPVTCGEIRLGWDSPVQEIVHPMYVNQQDDGGLGWLSGFNEWMVRCGVSFAGHPGDDDGIPLTLHGRIGNTPAAEVEVIVDDKPEPRIRIRGLVSERVFKFGSFDLWTEVSTAIGSHQVRFCDRLTNQSEYSRDYQIIYHTNFGPPILEESARFFGPIKEISPLNDYAGQGLNGFETYLAPTVDYGEQVYCLRLLADEQQKTTVMLQNASGNQGVAMRYDTSTLPAFNLWKNTDTLSDGYVTGLEPATGFPFNRSVERKNNRLPRLEPGETVEFDVAVEVLANASEVGACRERIESLQGDALPLINADPPLL